MGGKPRLPGVEAMYRKMRALAPVSAGVGVDVPARERLVNLAPGLAVLALRTPTLPPAATTNCYIVGDRELVIVDPATPEPAEKTVLDEVLEEMARAGRHPVAVWLTHHHGDHTADAARLSKKHGIPLAAHPQTAVRLPELNFDELLDEGHERDLGGERMTLRAVFTPGHAPGHLCFYEPSRGFCIAGDMVAGVGSILIDPDEGDMITYLASLRRLAGLGLKQLLPAHGPVLEDPKAALFAYVAHRLWREARVLDALTEDGRSLGDLLPVVYDDVPTFIFPLAERSLLSHLIKLEQEDIAQRQGGLWKMARR